VRGIQIHDQREKDISHTNKDIDFSKSHLNYSLHNEIDVNFIHEVNERIKGLNLKKAVRHDAIVMCQCLITSGHEFFNDMSYDEQKKFFEDSYKFVCDKYGKQNIISATVHLDERTPHLHVNFVPITSDGRLSAKDLFKKKDFSILHDEFYRHNQSKGYNLERGESKEYIQQHLTTEEFKIKKQKENLKTEQENLKVAQEAYQENKKKFSSYADNLNKELKKLTKILNEYDNLHIFEPEKIMFSDKVKVYPSEYEKLVALARVGILLYELKPKYDKLKTEYKELEKKVDLSFKSQLKHSQEISKLNEKYNKLACYYNSLHDSREEIIEFLKENNLMRKFKDYQEKLELEKEQHYERHQERGGMSL